MKKILGLVLILAFPVFLFADSEKSVRLVELIAALQELKDSDNSELRLNKGERIYLDLLDLESEFPDNPLYLITLSSAAHLAGNNPKALYFACQALSLDPFNRRMAAAFVFLLKEWVAEHPGLSPGYPPREWFIFRRLAPFFGVFFLVLSIVFGVFLTVLTAGKKLVIRQILIGIGFLVLAVSISLIFLIIPLRNQKAVVLKTTELLKNDYPQSVLIQELSGGCCVTLLQERSGWYRIRTPEGAIGWVPEDYLGALQGLK